MTVEFLKNPLCIDVKNPRLGWVTDAEQKQYRVVVSSSLDNLCNNCADLWDSGIIEGNDCAINYGGKPLESKKRYWWRVQINDTWGEPSWWETGILNEEQWQADWIGGGDKNAPYLRKTFDVYKAVKNARVYICGLGYYEMYLNGHKVGDHVLDPGTTDYEDRVLYSAYDVTDKIEKNNAIGVILGRGRYSMKTKNAWGWDERAPWHDQTKVICHINVEYDDGTIEIITSDETWKTADSPTIYDCLYTGELYDARLEIKDWCEANFDDSCWTNAHKLSAPKGKLKAQLCPPIKVMDEVKPVKINTLGKGHYVVDFGRQLTGWAKFEVQCSEGQKISIRYGEALQDDGTVNLKQRHVEGEIQTDRYIAKGQGKEKWTPKFSYKGFQYIELINCPEEFEICAKLIHTAVETIGDFTCSNELFNRIHNNVRRAILSNLHSIPTDTPVYEKNGWTGDAMLTAEAAMFNFDMSAFYMKWIQDIEDSQIESGEIATIIPTTHWGYTGASFGSPMFHGEQPPWDAAFILIPWWWYQYYGDARLIKNHFESMKKYITFLEKSSQGNILSRDGLGDWLAPTYNLKKVQGSAVEGAAIVKTAYYYLFTQMMIKFCAVTGEDDSYYKLLGSKIKEAFNANFYDKEQQYYKTPSYDGYKQTSNILPLVFGLVPESENQAVFDNLLKDIAQKNNHLDTGIIGTKYILSLLTERGHIDLAYEIANQKTYPSWGYMLENGATALWEAWEPATRSKNHHMYGSIDDWFYKYLAGIQPLTPGYETVRIKPYMPQAMDYAIASINTVRGQITVEWNREKGLAVIIPANVKAVVYFNNNIYQISGGKHEFPM